jgi:hypothetical protein
LTLFAAALAAAPLTAEALTFVIGAGATPRIRLHVGTVPGGAGCPWPGTSATITTVTFNVGAAVLGTGVPVVGAPVIRVHTEGRRGFGPNRTVTLTVDSSTPLSNGPATISFNQISWTASDADIPSGTFSGGPGQVLVSYTTSRRVCNNHTFRYANAQVVDAGTYTGRVRYTLSMP